MSSLKLDVTQLNRSFANGIPQGLIPELDSQEQNAKIPQLSGVNFRYIETHDARRLSEMRLNGDSISFVNLYTAGEYAYGLDLEDRIRRMRATASVSTEGSEHVLIASTATVAVGYLGIMLGAGKLSHVARMSVFVEEEHRRKGIGMGLVLAALEIAPHINVLAYEAETRDDNIGGMAFITQMGFKPNGIVTYRDEDRTQYHRIFRRFWRTVNPSLEVWDLQNPFSLEQD